MTDRIEQSSPTEGRVIWSAMLETPKGHPEPVVTVVGEADYILGFLAGTVIRFKKPNTSWLLTHVEVQKSSLT